MSTGVVIRRGGKQYQWRRKPHPESSPASNGPAPDDTDMLDASSPAMPASLDVPEGPVDDSELNVIDEIASGDEPVIAPDEVVESDGEALIHGDMIQDYVPIAELDVYEDEGLDHKRFGEMEADQRFEAWRRMRACECQEARRRGVHRPRALRSASPGADGERDRDYVRDLEADRRRRVAERAATGVYGDGGDTPVPNIETYQGPLRDWLMNDAVRRELKRRFRQFLQTYGTAGEFTERRAHMMERIFSMCEKNGESLYINYTILSDNVPILAVWLVDEPKTTLPILDEVAMELVSETFQGYKENIHDEIHVRIESLPLDDNIRDFRQVYLNGLIKVKGVITRRSAVFSQLKLARYNCVKCNFLTAPVVQTGEQEPKPNASCPNCQSRGPFIVNETQTVYRNFQRITGQETPGTVPAGRIPRHCEVIMTDDLIDFARPGDEVPLSPHVSGSPHMIHEHHTRRRTQSPRAHKCHPAVEGAEQRAHFHQQRGIRQIILSPKGRVGGGSVFAPTKGGAGGITAARAMVGNRWQLIDSKGSLGDRSIENMMAGARRKLDDLYSYQKDDTLDFAGGYLEMEAHDRPAYAPPPPKLSIASLNDTLRSRAAAETERNQVLYDDFNDQLMLVGVHKQHAIPTRTRTDGAYVSLSARSIESSSLSTGSSPKGSMPMNRRANLSAREPEEHASPDAKYEREDNKDEEEECEERDGNGCSSPFFEAVVSAFRFK